MIFKKPSRHILFITIPILALFIGGIVYGAVEYVGIGNIIHEVNDLESQEQFEIAKEKLDIVQDKWIVRSLGMGRVRVRKEVEKNEQYILNRSEFEEGLMKIDENEFDVAITILSSIAEDSFYYNQAKFKIEEAKRKIIEGELGEAKIATKEAEERAKQELIKRTKAEAETEQERREKESKEQQLLEKKAEEEKMNADNDGDGLSYRRELELGSSDFSADSDGDGINDGEDVNPNGGGRNIAENFEWEYDGRIWDWKYSIHEDWYEYYKNKPRSPNGTEYVTPDDPFIKEIAKALKETADEENYHLTSFLVSFIQGLPYVEDYYTNFDEYPKYPVETFVEGNGDCEDTSYLFASLVRSTGLGAVLIEFDDHMGVGVKTVHAQSGYYYPIEDDWYYYYETTAEDWKIGQLPDDYLYDNAKIIRIWDNSVHYSYPKYVKPCYAIPDFYGYYYDGSNYYSDSQCNKSVYCMPYKDLYYNPNLESFYWDSNCDQIITTGCYRSESYSGYFYDDYVNYYTDSRCIQRADL